MEIICSTPETGCRMMLTLISPAKVNLFLQILGKRTDGYHELASLFQTISLVDTLNFSLADRDTLTCTDPSIPVDASNLIWKAAHLFRLKTNQKSPIKIHIEKRIPIQAGLGGGSSNAATTLWALNKLLEAKIPIEVLVQWASEIGSDVPFFLSQGTAYCTGRGEIIKPLSPLPIQNLTIVKPPQGLSTPAVYSKLDLSLVIPRNSVEVLENFYKGSPLYFNDLEKAAFKIMPELANFKNSLLKSGFQTVLLSGSGSSFFCLGHSQSKINNSYSASFMNRSHTDWYKL
jgi:4-diphosphocytidyl-2-C-methyl-D-erythritol kinase